eukprot:Cvel_32132.t1-p1 / transcript=Cvel_32132.t1 / gene=Cvel_32132 / organism=Chromera_velia_CCMP2878 / gene_product=hypothetical protein / transcript_product=hypothetical protein / location=Cvel_scaffold4925:5323-6810(+) / protein_length=466 / sequence_SO=supercontig / SO=protein_coding / is_pseudo=false
MRVQALSFVDQIPGLAAGFDPIVLLHRQKLSGVAKGEINVGAECVSEVAKGGVDGLNYNPAIFRPLPYDVFLLSGVCRSLLPSPLLSLSPSPVVLRGGAPVFLVGCGRSGTTFLGEVLCRHSGLRVLDEPRQLWLGTFPEMDVWSSQAAKRGGRLAWGEGDLEGGGGSERRDSILRLYAEVTSVLCGTGGVCSLKEEERKTRGGTEKSEEKNTTPRLLEKFPEHAFRLPFLEELFRESGEKEEAPPTDRKGMALEERPIRSAQFIHLVRCGAETALSIAKMHEKGGWFGIGGKWKLDRLLDLVCSQREQEREKERDESGSNEEVSSGSGANGGVANGGGGGETETHVKDKPGFCRLCGRRRDGGGAGGPCVRVGVREGGGDSVEVGKGDKKSFEGKKFRGAPGRGGLQLVVPIEFESEWIRRGEGEGGKGKETPGKTAEEEEKHRGDWAFAMGILEWALSLAFVHE